MLRYFCIIQSSFFYRLSCISQAVFWRCKYCLCWLRVLGEYQWDMQRLSRKRAGGVEVECWLYNNHYSAEMAIWRGLSVLGPETLWLDFPCVAILPRPRIVLCHRSSISLCRFLQQFNKQFRMHVQVWKRKKILLSPTDVQSKEHVVFWFCFVFDCIEIYAFMHQKAFSIHSRMPSVFKNSRMTQTMLCLVGLFVVIWLRCRRVQGAGFVLL